VGNLSFFVNCDENDLDEDVLEKFIVQFYQKRQLPEIVMVNIPLDLGVLSDALSSIAGKKIKVQCPKIGINRQIINNVLENAKYAMVTKIADQENRLTIWKELKKILGMKNLPECIEVYDNSHIFGSHAVGAVIVIGKNGFLKSAYRCYHIKNISYGNDYAYLREVLTRRLGKLITSDAPKPELIIIDGGKGQLSTAYEVLSDIGLDIKILAIAKGKERKVGAEHYYTTDKLGNIEEVFFPKGSSNILHFLQAIRDEAHRFAIANYRKLHAKHLFKISPKD
jgi:excinuclease ABC subunit C